MRVRLEQQGVELVRECPSPTCGRCFGSNLERCPQCNSELTTPIPVERDLAGRYRLERHIGTGGIGRVYLAIDQQDGKKVAVKICSVNLFGNSVVVSGFNREAVCLAHLNHENIVRIRDFGFTGGGGVFIVMDFIEGSTWLARLKQTGPVPPATAALWFDQLLSALAAAHDSGIVHGDLKPSNVIVGSQATGREQITLLDFGIGRILGIGEELGPNRRRSGTWQYMSPERRRGADISPEDDIFAVGVMLVEMLTGNNPLAIVGPLQAQAFLAEEFLFPMRYAGKCKALCQILQKCVAAEPNQRFRSATELRAEVIPVLASCHPVAKV
jgi:serine/threonine-protein kinase